MNYNHNKPTALQLSLMESMKVLDPRVDGMYEHYQDDWLGFITDELGDEVPEMLENIVHSVQRHKITVVKSCTGAGKSWVGSRLAMTFYKLYLDSHTYLIAAPPLSNLMSNLIAKINSKVKQMPAMFASDEKKVMSIARDPEQFIQGLVIPRHGTDEERETSFSGRHQKYILVILDEGDNIPDFVFKAVNGWGSGGIIFRLVVFFNPKKKLGEAYRMIAERRANVITLSAFDHPNVITGKHIIPGAVTREETMIRVNEWTDHLPDDQLGMDGMPNEQTDGDYELPDYLVGLTVVNDGGIEYEPLRRGWYRVKPEYPEFSYKVLGQYPSSPLGMTIPERWIELARLRYDRYVDSNGSDEPPDYLDCIMGGDPADEGDDANSVCIRYEYLIYFRNWKGIDANESGKSMANIYHEFSPVRAYIDKNGVGAAVPGIMKDRDCKRVSGVFSQGKSNKRAKKERFRKKRDELYWAVRNWLDPDNGGNAMLPDDSEILDSLRALKHETIGGSIVFIDKKGLRKALGYSPNNLDALALTFARGTTMFGSI